MPVASSFTAIMTSGAAAPPLAPYVWSFACTAYTNEGRSHCSRMRPAM